MPHPDGPRVRPDPDHPSGILVESAGRPSSYLRLDDPDHLEFPYLRWCAVTLAQAVAEPATRHTVHLGGAGCTFARYLAARRPGSRQLVFESDPAMVDLARAELGFSRRSGFRLRHSDALAGLTSLTSAAWQVVLRDAFIEDYVPAHLTTLTYLREVARVLTPDGLYFANIADPQGAALLRKEIALARQVFPQVWLIGAHAQVRGGKYGNVILVAQQQVLPLPQLAARLSAVGTPVQVYSPAETAVISGLGSGNLGI